MEIPTDQKVPLFSFAYNGRDAGELLRKAEKRVTVSGGVTETEFLFPDGLSVTQRVTAYPAYGAAEWVLWLENKSAEKSGLVSELYDCDARFPFDYDPDPIPGFVMPAAVARIYNPTGSNWARDEFFPKVRPIQRGHSEDYACTGGRSSQGVAPFFDVNRGEKGVMFAVGWTGQWHARFSRDDTHIRIRSGIQYVSFRLLPGERIRTSSALVMPYGQGQTAAHNAFRRLIKQHYSPVGRPGRDTEGPLSVMHWGAMPSDQMIERIQNYKIHDLGFEYFWVDAAWYGSPDGHSPSEHVGDWWSQTGNWAVNTCCHPDGLLKVAEAVRDNGLKFLLWIEPERVISKNPMPREHPEWFLRRKDEPKDNASWLLNLGNPEALRGAVDLVSGYIEKLGLGCYRQDFNTEPLPYWQENDEPERIGMLEIRHIMGLYAFWDALLLRFPHLLIDNCASGGRRIDIETCRRSIPLWRSDYQCLWDNDAETSQTHSMGISWWLPYSGTGTGNTSGDTYRARSCYSPAMVMSLWGYEGWEMDPSQYDWVRRTTAEYKRVRPFLSCDYYPLLPPPMDDSAWAAMQYDRPEQRDGVIMVFRRPLSPCECARFSLGGVLPGKIYRFEDADSGEHTEIRSEDLLRDGFTVQIIKKRDSRLYFYSVID